MKFEMIPIDKIRPNPFQPREAFLREEIEQLAKSIEESDLVQPLLLRRKGETYEIIAGERRWRAAQVAGLGEIAALVREADDLETRELSLIENWHRLALNPSEAESFLGRLFEDGIKTGRYKSINDMSTKLGIRQQTISDILTAYKEREELDLPPEVTYTDLRETRVLRDRPELRKRVLKLREKEKLSRDELREFSKVVDEVSETVKEAMFALRIKPQEARIIETELHSNVDKEQAIRMIERERRPDRIVSLVRIIRDMGEIRRIELLKEIDTGDIWLCPSCKKKFHLIHVEPSGTHRFEEVVE
jgi:ParB/RepB/Spo0J family partition protein